MDREIWPYFGINYSLLLGGFAFVTLRLGEWGPVFTSDLTFNFFTFFEFSRKNHLINSKEQVQKVTFITKTGIFTDKFTDKSLINLLYYGSTRLSSSIQNGDYWLVQEHSRLVLERQCNCCERHLLREIDVILPAAPTAWLIG